MLVSGAIYTFIALLLTLGAVASIVYGAYNVATSITQAVVGNYERASMFFLIAIAMGAASWMFGSSAHVMARRSLELLNADPDEEEWEEDEDFEEVDGD